MMKQVELGRTGIKVNNYCLGTMTYGTQTSEEEAHHQLDLALDAGLDFLDTAEVYPVNPMTAETAGRTEEIIGNWVAKSGKRDKWVIATKHAGARRGLRNDAGVVPATIAEVVDGSLLRLQTDYIDLYQFHWPNRTHYHFRGNWAFDPSARPEDTETDDMMEETLNILGGLVKEGKIRAFGLSNDTAWGTMKWLETAKRTGGPRVATMQNEYSLMCRLYDTDMAEVSYREEISLLAFSPLAAGLLTGKYQNGAVPEGSRMTLGPQLGGRVTPRAFEAAEAYLQVGRDHGLDPVHMALAWTVTRPCPTIPIFGATTNAQLATIAAGFDVSLSKEVLAALSKAHRAHPMPY